MHGSVFYFWKFSERVIQIKFDDRIFIKSAHQDLMKIYYDVEIVFVVDGRKHFWVDQENKLKQVEGSNP